MKIFELISRNFFQHISTGEVFAVETRWNGQVIGAAGPLSPDALKDLGDYTYTARFNNFLQDSNNKLILMDPVVSC